MEINAAVLKNGERAMLALRALYTRYGYSCFKMSKFEEYDFYVHNRNFLRGDTIVTFTDNGGRLMALRPDVTLSIVKNVSGCPPQPVKVYYNENVYRETRGSREIAEIMQTGLECIGDIDLYQTGEVVLLAAQSLAVMGEQWVLDISHMGFLSALLEAVSLDEAVREKLIRCVRDKNVGGIRTICAEASICAEDTDRLCTLGTLFGPVEEVLPQLRNISVNAATEAALDELSALCDILSGVIDTKRINMDFSIVNDLSYYNGIIWNGFLRGIPQCVLSGGRYDPLLEKLGKKCGAIGFAVSLNLLERYYAAPRSCDADILLLYDDETDAVALTQAVRMLCDSGKTVRAQKTVPEGFRYRQLLRMKDRGLEILENNA